MPFGHVYENLIRNIEPIVKQVYGGGGKHVALTELNRNGLMYFTMSTSIK